MLQAAATSAQSSLALKVGKPAGALESAEVPQGFAALLALGATVEGEADALPEAIAAAASAALRQNGNATGKDGGKILPVGLPPKGAASAGPVGETETSAGLPPEAAGDPAAQVEIAEIPTDSPPPIPTTALAAPPAKTEPLHAKPAEPTQTARPPVPQAGGAPVLPAVAVAQRLPGPAPQAAPPAATAAANAQAPKAADADTSVKIARPIVLPVPATRTIEAPKPVLNSAVAGSAAGAVGTTPAENLPAAAQAPLPPKAAAGGPIGLTVASTVTSAAPAETSEAARPRPAPLAAATDATPPARGTAMHAAPPTASILKAGEAPAPEVQPAAVEKLPAAPAAKSAPVRMAAGAAVEAAGIAAEAQSTRILPATPGTAVAAERARPIAAAELQPMLAFREAQPLAPGSGNAPASLPSAAVQQVGYDFAALVDRLVEARDAAAPQAVRAAIHHADFGQVSLNFHADDARLTVSMTSADPDFAPTVQAAAAMQANSSADNGQNGQRQDGQGQQQQQASGSASGQTQSQGSSRSGERERTDHSRQPGSDDSGHSPDEARPDRRGGIYA